MRTYERLNAEVVKFEAQDVITASVARPECTCDDTCQYANAAQGHGTYTWHQTGPFWGQGYWEKTSECNVEPHNH